MKKQNINLSLLAGFIFIIIGIVTAIVEDFLAAVAALAVITFMSVVWGDFSE